MQERLRDLLHSVKRGGKHAITVFVMFIIGLVLGGVVIGVISHKANRSSSKGIVRDSEVTIDVHEIKNKITNIAELATLEYTYTNADKFEQGNQTFMDKWKIPGTSKTLVICYDATVEMGPELSKAEVDVDGNLVKVSVPKSTILSHEIDEKSFEYLVQDDSWLNKITDDDKQQLRMAAKQKMEDKILEGDWLTQADDRVKKQLEELITAMYPEAKITVELVD